LGLALGIPVFVFSNNIVNDCGYVSGSAMLGRQLRPRILFSYRILVCDLWLSSSAMTTTTLILIYCRTQLCSNVDVMYRHSDDGSQSRVNKESGGGHWQQLLASQVF
jgi:hypothetical protein